MKVNFEKRVWFEAKSKLLSLYTNFLSEPDFQYEPGKENRMMERIRTKLGISQREFYEMTGLAQ